MRKNLASLLSSLVLAGTVAVQAQNASYLQGVYIASDGTERKEAAGAEETLGVIHDEFLRAMGMRSRGAVDVAFGTLREQSAFGRIAAIRGSVDSSDVVAMVVLGAWRKDPKRIEFSSLLSTGSETITLDYVLNFILFVPVRASMVFLLAPPQFPFPLDMFQGQRPGIGGGGKYLVVLQPSRQTDFESSVEAFHDLVEKTGDSDSGDRNNDKMISMTEWLMLFTQLAKPEFTVLPYRILEGPDIQLKELQ